MYCYGKMISFGVAAVANNHKTMIISLLKLAPKSIKRYITQALSGYLVYLSVHNSVSSTKFFLFLKKKMLMYDPECVISQRFFPLFYDINNHTQKTSHPPYPVLGQPPQIMSKV